MSQFLALHCQHDSPELLLNKHWQRVCSQEASHLLLAVTFNLNQYWLAEACSIELTALYYRSGSANETETLLAVTDKPASVIEQLATGVGSAEEFKRLLAKHQLACFSDRQALQLKTVSIPKPWGQEIWYTGIEERGVAEVCEGEWSAPLPWVLAALPDALCVGRQASLILLKILDPLPEPVFGDLYFELHEEKREVYVVTAVDQRSWPDGVGAIRYGFNQDILAQYPNEQAFKAAFLAAVKAYEKIRRAIDAEIDRLRQRDSIALQAPVAAKQLKAWLAEVPEELQQRERELRAAMESFTAQRPLRVGDVVKVPTLTPHSLQHGVRTIEFQTPVYERLIVSFAQKVVTQGHWDTEQAVNLMEVTPPEDENHQILVDKPGVLVERVVDFKDFEVLRVRLAPGQQLVLQDRVAYRLLVTLTGCLDVLGTSLLAEQALLLPRDVVNEPLRYKTADNVDKTIDEKAEELSFLVANPK